LPKHSDVARLLYELYTNIASIVYGQLMTNKYYDVGLPYVQKLLTTTYK